MLIPEFKPFCFANFVHVIQLPPQHECNPYEHNILLLYSQCNILVLWLQDICTLKKLSKWYYVQLTASFNMSMFLSIGSWTYCGRVHATWGVGCLSEVDRWCWLSVTVCFGNEHEILLANILKYLFKADGLTVVINRILCL